jgi:hypothetical protein
MPSMDATGLLAEAVEYRLSHSTKAGWVNNGESHRSLLESLLY